MTTEEALDLAMTAPSLPKNAETCEILAESAYVLRVKAEREGDLHFAAAWRQMEGCWRHMAEVHIKAEALRRQSDG